MAGRKPDSDIAQMEDNLANLSEIAEAAHILIHRLQTAADIVEARRILAIVERMQAREKARRAQAQQTWK